MCERASGWRFNDYGPTYSGSVAAVEAAGGTITEPPCELPGGRRFHVADNSGNELAVWSEA